LALNFLWSPVFFAMHQTGWAFAIILTLLATILAFVCLSWSKHRLAAALFLPYAAWVAFASVLNGWIWAIN
jgi:benzodiazapine receptor